jgi:tRNA wybutosine-synthesizing protein 1
MGYRSPGITSSCHGRENHSIGRDQGDEGDQITVNFNKPAINIRNSMNKPQSYKLAIAAAVAIPITVAALLLANRYLNSNSNAATTTTANREDLTKIGSTHVSKVTILYATCTGTSRTFAHTLASKLHTKHSVTADVVDLSEFDEFILEKGGVFLFLISTFSEGQFPESSRRFMSWVQEFVHDFRVDKNYLEKVKFGVFGLGGKIYKKNFCTAARDLNNALVDLGAVPIVPSLCGDDASNLEEKFQTWMDLVVKAVEKTGTSRNGGEATEEGRFTAEAGIRPKKFFKDQRNAKELAKKAVAEQQARAVGKKDDSCCNSGSSVTTHGGSNECCKSQDVKGTAKEGSGCCGGSGSKSLDSNLAPPEDYNSSDEEEEDRINSGFVTMDLESDDEAEAGSSGGGGCGDGEEGDVEDIGRALQNAASKKEADSAVASSDREMVTKLQRKALVKEGYRIIGSHSAVKLCRWTKNQMRGRGGCYKHSFYGITSYQCMEATPSLACANKCVFCWRHHKNPVGTEWRWKTDSPSMIVEEAVSLHRTMINEMRGVPGVLPERLSDANNVKHCALSLVGEPIMYPKINEMLAELHNRQISSFLVTNAQFPERIEQLDPVTQLYVSVDAATKESLKAIDRPLFKNYWDRFIGALSAIKDKKQRTVYRLTLVKDWNMEETDAYAELIEMGQPGSNCCWITLCTNVSHLVLNIICRLY